MRRWTSILLCLAAAGCHHGHRAKPDGGAARAGMPLHIVVNDHRKGLLFSWKDEKGAYHDTSQSQKVPVPYRKHVLVRDLTKTPEALHASQYLYVADLTQKDDGGNFPYAVVSRYQFHLPTVYLSPDGGVEDSVVTLYGTSWCGACAQARAYLKAHHIPFVDKDIEKDPQAARELAAKAKRAGINPSGIPVIDVRGHLLVGFSPTALQQALRGS